jgi:hypothetical protein
MFTVLKNVLSNDSLEIIKNTILFTKKQHYFDNNVPESDHNFFTGSFIKHDCWEMYGIPISESVLLNLLPTIEHAVNKKLYPTYSFARVYWPGADMEKHTDRPSCEYSASLAISVDPAPWSIWMDGVELFLNPGDMVVYKGMEVEHWRETYTGTEQVQLFLHYVDANGPHAECKYDYRKEIGVYPWK